MSQTQSSPKPASVTSSNQGRRDHDSANYHLHKDGSTPDKLRSLMRAYLACFACIIPGLALGIPAGLRDHYMRDQMLLPAMGLLPMGLGAIFALIRAIDLGFRFKRAYRIMLPNAEFDIRKHAAFWTPLLECVTNLVFAGTILTALSFFWAIAPNRGGWGWNDAGGAMLDAYATMPMMTAIFLHIVLAYKVLPSFQWRIALRRIDDDLCSRCRGPSAPLFVPSSPQMSGAVADV